MSRSRPITTLAGLTALPLIALAVAACGGGGGATAASPPSKTTASPTQTTTAASPPKRAAATVSVANNGKLGQILVNSQGRTLYLFKADVGTKSACAGACATAWPPLLVTAKPTAGNGASASLLGTASRSDGTQQVTYGGHPLYLYVGDTKPGDGNGQGVTAFGAAWFVLTPAGAQVGG